MAADTAVATASAAPEAHAKGVDAQAGGGNAKLTAAQKRRARLKQSKAAKQAVRWNALGCMQVGVLAAVPKAHAHVWQSQLRLDHLLSRREQVTQRPAEANGSAQVSLSMCLPAELSKAPAAL